MGESGSLNRSPHFCLGGLRHRGMATAAWAAAQFLNKKNRGDFSVKSPRFGGRLSPSKLVLELVLEGDAAGAAEDRTGDIVRGADVAANELAGAGVAFGQAERVGEIIHDQIGGEMAGE